jgi:hypothetical protein
MLKTTNRTNNLAINRFILTYFIIINRYNGLLLCIGEGNRFSMVTTYIDIDRYFCFFIEKRPNKQINEHNENSNSTSTVLVLVLELGYCTW